MSVQKWAVIVHVSVIRYLTTVNHNHFKGACFSESESSAFPEKSDPFQAFWIKEPKFLHICKCKLTDYRVHYKYMYVISNQFKLQIRGTSSAVKLNAN